MADDIIYWEVDSSDVEEELDRISKGLDYKLVRELDFSIETAFEQTQRIVHQPPRITSSGYVLTGSLRATGRVDTYTRQRRMRGRFATGYDWAGVIQYGGAAPGWPNDPVDYAGYESSRGQDHDFMRPVGDTEVQIEAAILDFYGRE